MKLRITYAALILATFVFAWLAAAQSRGAAPQAPIFEVDPFWPKPLPNHRVLGSTIGLSVDAQDHVWVIHRPSTVEDNFKAADFDPPIGVCCKVAPPVLEFDPAGNLVSSWGGPGAGYEWPESNHGITVDSKGNVWLGGNGNTDTQILKFDKNGKFILQVGKQGTHNGSNDLIELLETGEDLRRSRCERGLYRGWLRQPPRRRAGPRHRQVQTSLGRIRQQARRCAGACLYPDGAAFRSISIRCIAPTFRRTIWCTFAIVSIIAFRSFARTARLSKKPSSTRTR